MKKTKVSQQKHYIFHLVRNRNCTLCTVVKKSKDIHRAIPNKSNRTELF